MTTKRSTLARMLAIDPISRGFGFVVLEGRTRLIDWGVKETREDKERMTLEKVRELVTLYRPRVIVLEDCTERGSRRGPRVEALIVTIAEEARRLHVRVRFVSMERVHAHFANVGAKTKQQIIRVIAAQFPALALWRPPVRKAWMSEDPRTAIFDAAAMAAVFLNRPLGLIKSADPTSSVRFGSG